MENQKMSPEQVRCLWQCYALLLELAGEDEALTEMAIQAEENSPQNPAEFLDKVDTDGAEPRLSGDEPENTDETV